MRIYQDGNVIPSSAGGFEIDNTFVPLNTIVRILRSIDGVTQIKKRRLFSKWEDIHIWFKYNNRDFIVLEPYGDNSRYWIGLEEEVDHIDIKAIHMAFESYKLSLWENFLGGGWFLIILLILILQNINLTK